VGGMIEGLRAGAAGFRCCSGLRELWLVGGLR
jgi:hypothetical protein